MAAYRGLISLADVQSVLPSITTSVARMRIKHASDRFEKDIGRRLGIRFYPEGEGEIIETFGREWLYVASYPIRSVSAVLYDGEEQDLEDVENQAQRYNDEGVLSLYAPRGTVVRAEYAGGYVLPGDSVLSYNRAAGPIRLTAGSSDVNEVTVVGLNEDGEAFEEVITLNGVSQVSSDANVAPGGAWEVYSYGHTGTVTISVAGQQIGTLKSCQNIAAATDVPGDIQAVLLDMVIANAIRPVKGVQREEVPGGAKIQWSTQQGERSDLEYAYKSIVGRYRRSWIS